MKKFLVGLVLGLLLATAVNVSAVETTETITVIFDRIQLVVNGEYSPRETILYNGTTYVPIRATAELLGMDVDYIDETYTAVLSWPDGAQGPGKSAAVITPTTDQASGIAPPSASSQTSPSSTSAQVLDPALAPPLASFTPPQSSVPSSASSSDSDSTSTPGLASKSGSTSTSNPASSATDPTSTSATPKVITESDAHSKLIALKERYPHGTPWTNETSYTKFQDNIYFVFSGCAAFAEIALDEVFGSNTPSRYHYDLDKIKIGDVIRINYDTHSVVVLNSDGSNITVAEGNYNKAVSWGRTLSISTLKEQGGVYIETRY
ncbi:MAG: copper amine oxidase N-terminal domain-containing protein [Oscillospiraceae bacterium]|nr:copper amine oxidase N-terminal domain-containing protein [Oscillospiraceae bacterium]